MADPWALLSLGPRTRMSQAWRASCSWFVRKNGLHGWRSGYHLFGKDDPFQRRSPTALKIVYCVSYSGILVVDWLLGPCCNPISSGNCEEPDRLPQAGKSWTWPSWSTGQSLPQVPPRSHTFHFWGRGQFLQQSLWRFSFATSSMTLLTHAPGKALALLADRSWEKNLPGHQRATNQEVWGSSAFALLPSSKSNLFGHGPLSPSPSASLFLVCFGRLLLPGWGLRNLVLKSNVGARGLFNHSHPGILDERLLISTRGADLRGITRRICLIPGSSRRRSHSLCLFGGWGVDRATLDCIPSNSRCTCFLRELSSLWRSSVAAFSACEWLASPLLAGVLSSILASKVLRLCSVLLRRYYISLSRAAWSCPRVRSSLSATTQNMHLVKRVISAAQLASESMIHLLRLQWAQKNFSDFNRQPTIREIMKMVVEIILYLNVSMCYTSSSASIPKSPVTIFTVDGANVAGQINGFQSPTNNWRAKSLSSPYANREFAQC